MENRVDERRPITPGDLLAIYRRYEDVISLASGRPNEAFFVDFDIGRYLERYQTYRASQGATEKDLTRLLFQYGPPGGQIGDLVARMLATDEGLEVDPSSILITNGCQESLIVTLRALCIEPSDVIVAPSPVYFGLLAAAQTLRIPVVHVPEGSTGLQADAVLSAIASARARQLTPRAVYVAADLSDPGGHYMNTKERERIVQLAEREDLHVIEDSAYRVFRTARKSPALKALDNAGRVLHLGSFAKSCAPGLRVGYLISDQYRRHPDCTAENLVSIKNSLSVHTSGLAQAAVGGYLIEHDFSMAQANRPRAEHYKRHLSFLLEALSKCFPGVGQGPKVRWNRPDGGFFVTVHVPFETDLQALEESARDFGVAWAPMRMFSADPGIGRDSMRLACSEHSEAELGEAVHRLAAFIGHRLNTMPLTGPSRQSQGR